MKMKRTPIINLPSDLKTLHYFMVIAAAFVLVFAGGAWATDEKTSLKMDLPPPDVPQPQLFCGYCHVLTYQGVVQKGYKLWIAIPQCSSVYLQGRPWPPLWGC
jgi:hypothetical protein